MNKKNYEPLNREKKEILKNAMASASCKEIDFNKVRDEWKYSDKTEDEKFEDFMLFLADVMGYNLYDYQKVFLKSMFKNKATNTNPFMNNKGYEKMQKYALCLRQGLSGEKVLIATPTEEKAKQTMDELTKLLLMGNIKVGYQVIDNKVMFNNGGEIEVR